MNLYGVSEDLVEIQADIEKASAVIHNLSVGLYGWSREHYEEKGRQTDLIDSYSETSAFLRICGDYLDKVEKELEALQNRISGEFESAWENGAECEWIEEI